MLLLLLLITSCNNKIPHKEIIYVPVEESTVSKDSLTKLVNELEQIRRAKSSTDSLLNVVDSLSYIIDSLAADNVIKNIKLERIRYYNQAAGKSNNIVFLRGWINRVLDDTDK